MSRKLFQVHYSSIMALWVARISAPLQEIWVAEHFSDIRFWVTSRNMVVLHVRSQEMPESAL